MLENSLSGSEGGGTELNRFSLPLSKIRLERVSVRRVKPATRFPASYLKPAPLLV
jgi:hypothetical protein